MDQFKEFTGTGGPQHNTSG